MNSNLGLLFSCLCGGVVAVLLLLRFRPKPRVRAEDCLKILSYREWKSGKEIWDQLEREKKYSFTDRDVYDILQFLQRGGWVESRASKEIGVYWLYRKIPIDGDPQTEYFFPVPVNGWEYAM